MKTTGEKGQVYGVDLIESVPIGVGMLQAMPGREELEMVRKNSERTAAAFEVLLSMFHDKQENALAAISSIIDNWEEWDEEAQQAAQIEQNDLAYRSVMFDNIKACLWRNFGW